MLNRYAVMGNPVAHSLSPVIHQSFAKQIGIELCYEKIQVQAGHLPEEVRQFFLAGGKGLNITLPFKEEAFALAAKASQACQQAKAANTLWMEEGCLQADNTDGRGLITDLSRHVDLAGKTILMLGAGGAARGVIAPLLAANIDSLSIVNRTFSKALALQKDFPQIHCLADQELRDEGFDIVIHATSAGIRQEALVWPETILKTAILCYDLSYSIEGQTPFVSWAKAKGCLAMDGLGMLVEQAAAAFQIWHGVLPDTESVLKILGGVVTKNTFC